MRVPWYKSDRSVGIIAISLVLLIGFIVFSRPAKKDETMFSHSEHLPVPEQNHRKNESSKLNQAKPIITENQHSSSQSNLETLLKSASMANKTLIITMLNKAYSESDGLFNLFLESFHQGEETQQLIKHILFLTVDQDAFSRCIDLNLHCYKIGMDGGDFSDEVLFMTNGFIDMMWTRTRFLGQVLRLGYNFIFTDMDILWLRNPFTNLKHKDEDMLLSCDGYIGLPYDDRNAINTGFFFTSSNSKTIILFQKWYDSRNNSKGMKEQDVLNYMKSQGEFRNLGMKVRYLDLEHFSGMCQTKYNAKKVTTVHANCCRTMKAKVLDLKAMLDAWRVPINGDLEVIWPRHRACHGSWKIIGDEDDEMEVALKSVSGEEKIIIITIINKVYIKENGFLDLFLRSLREGVQTDYLIDRILFVAVDKVAFNRCMDLYLNCYMIEMDGSDFSQEDLDGTGDFTKMMGKIRIDFLGQVLKRGYSFLFTDIDVLWLRNPFNFLRPKKSDVIISSDGQTGQPSDGFFFVSSNNKTISFFDNLYSENNGNNNKIQGGFSKFDMKVKYLDTKHFSGLCQDKYSVRKVIILHANCCRNMKEKLSDLKAMFQAWVGSNYGAAKNVKWPAKRACIDSQKVPDEIEMGLEAASLQNKTVEINISDELKTLLETTSMENKTLIITMINQTNSKEDELLDLFLKSLRQGEQTETLINHLLLVCMDDVSFDHCKALNLHCYKGGNFTDEGEMMRWKIQFYGDVVKLGYNFIFTDVDILWLRNPFQKLNRTSEDLLVSCDRFDGLLFNESTNPILNSSFFFIFSNNKTITFLTNWYEQYANNMKSQGIFANLGMEIRVLDNKVFSGFCEHGDNFNEVVTVHANCCSMAKAKIEDLKEILETFKGLNGTDQMMWPNQEACHESGGL